MSSDTTYNGWTNYATWRLNLELADDIVQSLAEDCENDADAGWLDAYDLSKEIQRQCEDAVTQYGSIEGLAADYAMAFMDDVNWYEISEHAIADYPALLGRDDDE